jgi:hypothetical protein
MLGEAGYRAVNDPIPAEAGRAALERLSDEIDAALDRLDALIRAGDATAISLDYVAEQFDKAGGRLAEVETRVEELDLREARFLPEAPAGAAAQDEEVVRAEFLYEHYPELIRDDSGAEAERDQELPGRGR